MYIYISNGNSTRPCCLLKRRKRFSVTAIDVKTTIAGNNDAASKCMRTNIVVDRWVWSGGAMVLGKLPLPGRPTILITVGQGPTALAVGAGGSCWDIFILIYLFSPLSPSLWETARYRLKYCLKGPLNPKQPTNQNRRSVSFFLSYTQNVTNSNMTLTFFPLSL